MKEDTRMKKMMSFITKTVTASALGLLTSCAEPQQGDNSLELNQEANLRPSFKMLLTDAPNLELKSVFINVQHVEIWVEGGGHSARIITSLDLGIFDLLRLQNGALLPLNNLNLPEDTIIKKFRIILKDEGHAAIKSDDSICLMKTPGAQKSGLKINLRKPILLQKNSGYTIVLDFDAKKSVVQQGNGKCLLKPVLKLKKAIVHDIDDSLNGALDSDINHENDIPSGGDDLIGDQPVDNGEDDSTGGFDYSDPTSWPPDMTPEEFNALF